jgi:tight adherence protein C
MEILAAIIVAITIFFGVLAFSGGASSVRSRLDALKTSGPGGDRDPGVMPAKDRLVTPMMDGMVRTVRRVMPATMLSGIQKKLVLAGDPMTMNGFLTFQFISTAGFLLLPVIVLFAAGITISLIMLGVLGAFALVGFMLPNVWLQQRANGRRSVIIKGLPDAFDLITTCVEAGLGLDAALSRVAEKVEGPFADELSRTLREISLGKLRRDALKEMAERTDVPDLISFVNAVIQAEQMGSSVGAVLRVQAEQLRVRRRQRAEEQAYKAPVKMIFPLVLCIFPTLFIVILGPAVITIMQDFPGGN